MKHTRMLASAVLASVLGFGLTNVVAAADRQGASQAVKSGFQRGKASWYGPGLHGRVTANGERFNTNALTAAHKTLPFGTKVKVTNARTGKSVVVRINDRGPYAHGRVIDLSKASARAIGIMGVADVALSQL